MGTSTNQGSPEAGGWLLQRALVGRIDVSAEQQTRELWQAVLGDRGERLAAELGAPIMAAAALVASNAQTPLDAIGRFNAAVKEQRAVGLSVEMGKRALLRAVATAGGARSFSAELFAEVASYYVSRDLPSYIGANKRISTASDAVRLKEGIRAITRGAARAVDEARGPGLTPARWRAHVDQVVRRLRGIRE
jgi:hypothetical protein